MLKEFIEHIQKITQPIIQQIGGSTFVVKGIGGTEELHPAIYHPDTLPLHSLEVSAPFQNVVFRRNGMSFFTGQHTGDIQPYTPHHLPV